MLGWAGLGVRGPKNIQLREMWSLSFGGRRWTLPVSHLDLLCCCSLAHSLPVTTCGTHKSDRSEITILPWAAFCFQSGLENLI